MASTAQYSAEASPSAIAPHISSGKSWLPQLLHAIRAPTAFLPRVNVLRRFVLGFFGELGQHEK
ncbi:MAG TPA: hypothetical protein VFN62_05195 [Acidobacteriaceae bacterium]|nr:hypothetical protein [Acidobacteriaceae bacterium]